MLRPLAVCASFCMASTFTPAVSAPPFLNHRQELTLERQAWFMEQLNHVARRADAWPDRTLVFVFASYNVLLDLLHFLLWYALRAGEALARLQIVCYDQAALQLLRQFDVPCLHMPTLNVTAKQRYLRPKALLVPMLLRRNVSVLVSDLDVLWLRSPLGWLATQHAGLVVSREPRNVSGIPLQRECATTPEPMLCANTGLVYYRHSDAAAYEFSVALARRILHGVGPVDRRGRIVGDQGPFARQLAAFSTRRVRPATAPGAETQRLSFTFALEGEATTYAGPLQVVVLPHGLFVKGAIPAAVAEPCALHSRAWPEPNMRPRMRHDPRTWLAEVKARLAPLAQPVQLRHLVEAARPPTLPSLDTRRRRPCAVRSCSVTRENGCAK